MHSTLVNVVEQLDDDLWVITETESVHCYVILGTERALVVDAGYGYEDIHPLLTEITDLPVGLVLTHGDPDHGLGATWFDDVMLHPLDWGKLHMNDTEKMRADALSYRLKKMPWLAGHIDEETYLARRINQVEPHFLLDGDTIDLGGTVLRVLHTPGHSFGHIMLLDEAHGRLFSGDQVSLHNVWYFASSDEQAPFSMALASLKRVLAYRECIKEVYPAHDRMPIGIEAVEDEIVCLEQDLPEHYEQDERFDSFLGTGGYRHVYRSCELIYSDARLAEYLGHPIER